MSKQFKHSRAQINHISGQIINSAIKVHSNPGPGLIKSAYEKCLLLELEKTGLFVRSRSVLPIYYGGEQIGSGYRADMVVENSVIVELKSIEKIKPLHVAQLLRYLRLSGFQLGLLINFNVLRLTDGIRRLIHEVLLKIMYLAYVFYTFSSLKEAVIIPLLPDLSCGPW